jgi:hypothetical protein
MTWEHGLSLLELSQVQRNSLWGLKDWDVGISAILWGVEVVWFLRRRRKQLELVHGVLNIGLFPANVHPKIIIKKGVLKNCRRKFLKVNSSKSAASFPSPAGWLGVGGAMLYILSPSRP